MAEVQKNLVYDTTAEQQTGQAAITAVARDIGDIALFSSYVDQEEPQEASREVVGLQLGSFTSSLEFSITNDIFEKKPQIKTPLSKNAQKFLTKYAGSQQVEKIESRDKAVRLADILAQNYIDVSPQSRKFPEDIALQLVDYFDGLTDVEIAARLANESGVPVNGFAVQVYRSQLFAKIKKHYGQNGVRAIFEKAASKEEELLETAQNLFNDEALKSLEALFERDGSDADITIARQELTTLLRKYAPTWQNKFTFTKEAWRTTALVLGINNNGTITLGVAQKISESRYKKDGLTARSEVISVINFLLSKELTRVSGSTNAKTSNSGNYEPYLFPIVKTQPEQKEIPASRQAKYNIIDQKDHRPAPKVDMVLVPLANPEMPEWREKGLCAQTDPEAFYPEKGGSTLAAKKICLGCVVRLECLNYALDNDERFGIWGGLSERERRKIKKKPA